MSFSSLEPPLLFINFIAGLLWAGCIKPQVGNTAQFFPPPSPSLVLSASRQITRSGDWNSPDLMLHGSMVFQC